MNKLDRFYLCLLFSLLTFEATAGGKNQPKAVNQELLDKLKKYEIATVRHYHDADLQNVKAGMQTEVEPETGVHMNEVFITIETKTKNFNLELMMNSQMCPDSFSVAEVMKNGEIVMKKPSKKELNFCYYHGTVRGIKKSRVAVNTCNGLRGSISLPDELLFIEPLHTFETFDASTDNEYVLYDISDLKDATNGTCGHEHGDADLTSMLNEMKSDETLRKRRELAEYSDTFFVELLIVADMAEVTAQGGEAVTVARVLELVNVVDFFYIEIGVRIVLIHIELWTDGDQIDFNTGANQVLFDFRDYRLQRKATDPPTSPWLIADNAMLLYGSDFTGSTIGVAFTSGICTSNSVSVNQDYNPNAVLVGAVMTHELGHNFGLPHTDDYPGVTCSCTGSCIMNPSIGSIPFSWSDCSLNQFEINLGIGFGFCLTDIPNPSDIFAGSRTCGNEIIDVGEQCDCGLPEYCNSTCCNATTCQLLPGAQCDCELCCQDCQILPGGTQCRSASNECELAEYCDGLNANCPDNTFVENGIPCNANQASCFDGTCLTKDMQCADMYQQGATSCPDSRYFTNRRGDQFGNCGINGAGNFIACSVNDDVCGKILCAVPGNPTFSRDNFRFGPVDDGCFSKISVARGDMVDPYLVRTGTSCGSGQACNFGVCEALPNLDCSDKCNNNGVCNELQNCHCDIGWAPPFCNETGYGGSVDSGTSIDGVSVEFEFPTYDVTEGNQVQICVLLTAPHGPLVFSFSFTWETMSGTADSSDFDGFSETQTYPAGTQTNNPLCRMVSAVTDGEAESTENFSVVLADPISGIIGSQSTTMINIANVVPVTLSVAFSSPMFSFSESDGLVSVCANLSVSGAATSDSDLEVEVDISDGTAEVGTHFVVDSPANRILFYPTGSTDGQGACIVFGINDDADVGPNAFRSFTVALMNVEGGSLGNPQTATVQIMDDDVVPVTLSVAFSSPMFSFSESDGLVSVCANLSVSGAATSDSDLEVEVDISDGTAEVGTHFVVDSPANRILFYPTGSTDGQGACIVFGINDDADVGPNAFRSFTVALMNVEGGSLGNPQTATVQIMDDDVVTLSVAFSSPMFSFLESDGLVSVCANLSVSGAAMSDSVLTVTLNRTDVTAEEETHYVFPGPAMLVYPAGSNDGMQRCSQFTILDDVTAGPNSFRFLIIDLINVVGGSLGNPPTTTVKILDDDATVAFGSPSYDVTEGDQVDVCVVLFAPLGTLSSNFSFMLQTFDGTAVQNADYIPFSEVLTFFDGTATNEQFCINITTIQESLVESTEDFTVELSDPSNGVIVSPSSTTINIMDDDAGISISCDDASATLTVNQVDLTDLGVGPNDYLIINDVVEDDVSEIASDCKLKGDNGGGSLTFALNECNPTVENTNDVIYITWYARNAEQDIFKRKNHCHKLVCKYYRKDLITAPPVAVTLTKLELEEISGSGEIPVKLETFSDFSRNTTSRSFVVPQTIYVRASISNALPNSFFVQIESCFATDPEGIEMYSLINDGVADVSDPNGNVVAPVPPDSDYVPLQQDFQFDSFVWTDDESENAIIIRCCVYLCDSDATGVDCATTMLAPVGVGRRRRNVFDDYKREITSDPVYISKTN